MPYREVTMFEVKEVVRLWLAGIAKKQIAARLGLDPKTVRRYVKSAGPRSCSIRARNSGLQRRLRRPVVRLQLLPLKVPAT